MLGSYILKDQTKVFFLKFPKSGVITVQPNLNGCLFGMSGKVFYSFLNDTPNELESSGWHINQYKQFLHQPSYSETVYIGVKGDKGSTTLCKDFPDLMPLQFVASATPIFMYLLNLW